MKILIVDDNPKRYERLIAALSEIEIGRDRIDLVTNTNHAREKIDLFHYDLMVLDILIPLWPESEESAQHSADLLFEIREGELKNSPDHILGITADRDVALEALVHFEKYTWTVLNYASDHDEWVERAVNCVKYISGRAAPDAKVLDTRVDLAIVCALPEPEQSEILALPWNWSAPRPINDMIFVHDGHLEASGRRLSVCVTTAPRMGMVSAALRTAAVVAELRPKLLAMTGICAGVRGKVGLGDVLFADPAWDFQSGKRVRDKENTQFSIRPHHLPASAHVRSHIEQIRDDRGALATIAANFQGDPGRIPKIQLGPVASGSAVLADGEVIKEIRTQHNQLIGVEMEIYGLYAAAQIASRPRPECFALKGVCDFADPDKEDEHQRFAAYASAQVLRLLMERYGDRLAYE